MAQFTNQAHLTYGNTVTSSNIAVGEVVTTLTATKTAVRQTYSQGSTVTYIINLINSGSAAITDITVNDNLGEYTFGIGTLVPLSYIDGTLLYFADGVLQPSPTVTATDGLVITDISVPANGNALLVYETSVNAFAPINDDGSITNTVTVVGECANVIASETVTAVSEPQLTITKAISPIPVSCGETVTYTFLIQNTGSVALVTTDNAVITDTFNPILSNVTATFNGSPIEFSYNEATGEFATTGPITVDAATFTQDLTTGVWSVNPASSTLIVTGTI